MRTTHIDSEDREMPGMRRTLAQAARLWALPVSGAGRKMGHVVLLDDDTERSLTTAAALISVLTSRS